MRLIFLSGLSGSGKSVALHVLEDLDFYCIDNIPAALLQSFISHTVHSGSDVYERTAIGIDARTAQTDISAVPALIAELKASGLNCELVFLVADDDELLRRFAETRRKHPLNREHQDLREAIALERRVLEPIINAADLVVDTSRLSVHELRELIARRLGRRPRERMSILFESFGFKNGIPGDADFVFDARSLPNPYWDPVLRPLTGRDEAVVRFLEAQSAVRQFIEQVAQFIDARIPEHQAANRRYLTVAIGCTGGQHRSVYIAERLAAHAAERWPQVSVRHSSLPDTVKSLRTLPARREPAKAG